MISNLVRVLRLRVRGVHCSLDHVRIDRDSRVDPGARLAHHVELLATTIRRYTSIGRFTKCQYADIGAFCSVSWDATIGATAHPADAVSTHAFAYRREVGGFTEDVATPRPRAELGPDVWVGAHVVVMPGVQVGAGAILGAGAIVTKDVLPYSVVVGSPAREIRKRIAEPFIPRLLRIAWWDWPTSTLRDHVELFRSPLDEVVMAKLEAVAKRAEERA